MTVYVPGTQEKDLSKVIRSLQAVAASNVSGVSSIGTQTGALTIAGGNLSSSVIPVSRYDVAQSLTGAQQTQALVNVGAQSRISPVWNSEYAAWSAGTSFAGLTTGTNTSDQGTNGPGGGGTITVSKSNLTIAAMASVASALPQGSDRPRYAKNVTWGTGPTSGEGRTGYTGYFSFEEMETDPSIESAGQQVTVSAVLWTNIGTSIPNVYLYAAQETGSGGNSGRSGNTISGTGAGTDYNHLASEIFNRSALFSVNSTPTLYSYTVTLDDLSLATLGTGIYNLIIGVGTDYTAIAGSQQINMTALTYAIGPVVSSWSRVSDAQATAMAIGQAQWWTNGEAVASPFTAGHPPGEYISSTVLVGSAVGLSNGIAKDVTSISLSAGDWDVEAALVLGSASGAVITQTIGWTSTVSATLPTFPNNGAIAMIQATLAANSGAALSIGRQKISGPTTVYLSGLASFGSGSANAYGFISARRVWS